MPIAYADKFNGLTHTRLLSVLDYNSESGKFTWIVPIHKKVGKRKIGRIAGCLRKVDGYITICVDGKSYLAQRLAWFYVHKKWPEHQIDHKNEDRSDNRILNLREATRQQNSYNSSKSLGVYKTSSGYFAKVAVNGKSIYLGHFKSKIEAIEARIKASLKFHGEFSPYTKRARL